MSKTSIEIDLGGDARVSTVVTERCETTLHRGETLGDDEGTWWLHLALQNDLQIFVKTRDLALLFGLGVAIATLAQAEQK